jgi:hypothetical protein
VSNDNIVIWEPPASLPEIKPRKWGPKLAGIRSRPGYWGRLETYQSKRRAIRGYHYLKDKYTDGYEFSWSQVPPPSNSVGGTVLWGVYGRYIG